MMRQPSDVLSIPLSGTKAPLAAPGSVRLNPEVLDLVLRYAQNPTAFMALYDGFQYFRWNSGSVTGLIAYYETKTAWVGAADPTGPQVAHRDILQAFAEAAKKVGKVALLLPTSRRTAEISRELGYFTVQIGSEPWLSLETGRNRFSYYQMLPIAKQLKSMGASVERFNLTELNRNERAEIEAVTTSWLTSRKCAPLSFLNRLEPWTLSPYKRYFRLVHDGQVQGFIAAVPVPARKAWYLVDLIRLPDAIPGTTEMLVIEAMEELRREGAKEVTLGMSPLVPVEKEERARRPWTYRMMDLVFEKMSAFYGFKSLFNYKKKFRPDHWEECHLIVLQPALDWRAGYGLFRALFPASVAQTAVSSLIRLLNRWTPAAISAWVLAPTFMPRRRPSRWGEALSACRATLALTFICVVSFLFTVLIPGRPLNEVAGLAVGFSWDRFVSLGLSLTSLLNVILSGFFHAHSEHLIFNLVTLLIFGGLLEMIAGTYFMLLTFFSGLLTANILTVLMIEPALKIINLDWATRFGQEVDIGSSLGIFACLGALLYFSKRPKMGTALIITTVIGYCLANGTLLELNHLVALAIGAVLAKRYVS